MTGEKDVKQSTFLRIQRRILIIPEFNATFFHIAGSENVFADLLARWGYLGAASSFGPDRILSTDIRNWTLTQKGIQSSEGER
eukprot:snap_masked-scaffold_26-processed-gene-4.84-mRNA-1 protein AED:1.00 eAED:1.00 QI:0/-1/0/0/-1/1/1/0/82